MKNYKSAITSRAQRHSPFDGPTSYPKLCWWSLIYSFMRHDTKYCFHSRWMWRCVCLVLLVSSYIISLPNSVVADEAESAAAKAKPYKIVFQGNQALSETALRRAAILSSPDSSGISTSRTRASLYRVMADFWIASMAT